MIIRRFSTQSASSWKSVVVVGANHCSHGDVNSGVPRVHQRVFAACLVVSDVWYGMVEVCERAPVYSTELIFD